MGKKIIIVIIAMVLYNLESPPILYLIFGLLFWLANKYGDKD